jgi:hypothetical protein
VTAGEELRSMELVIVTGDETRNQEYVPEMNTRE